MPPVAGDEYDIPSDSLFNPQMPNLLNPLVTKANCPLLKTRIECVEALVASVVIPRLPELYSLLKLDSVIVSSVRL